MLCVIIRDNVVTKEFFGHFHFYPTNSFSAERNSTLTMYLSSLSGSLHHRHRQALRDLVRFFSFGSVSKRFWYLQITGFGSIFVSDFERFWCVPSIGAVEGRTMNNSVW